MPSIAITPRDGSFALALFGRIRKVHESPCFALSSAPERADSSAGRRSFALKRIAEAFLDILLDNIYLVSAKQQLLMPGAQDFGV
jgi:hypothetical protein